MVHPWSWSFLETSYGCLGSCEVAQKDGKTATDVGGFGAGNSMKQL